MTSWHLPHCSPGWPPLCSLRRCRCWLGIREAPKNVLSLPALVTPCHRCGVPHPPYCYSLQPYSTAARAALGCPSCYPCSHGDRAVCPKSTARAAPPHPRAATQPRACERLLGPPRRGGRGEATGSHPGTDPNASGPRVVGGVARVSILTFCRGFLPRLGAMAPSSPSQWSQHASEVASGSPTDSGSWCRRRALHH